MIFEDRDLCYQALDQHFVKLRDGGLALDEILQVLAQAHLLITDNAVYLGLLSYFPEPEDLIGNGIVRSGRY